MKFRTVNFIMIALVVVLVCEWDGQTCQAASYSGKVGFLVKSAENYSNQGNHVMASMMYDQAVRMQPGDLELYYRRAASYGRAGYYQNAINDLSRVISSDEMSAKRRFPSARKFRAECYAKTGLMQKAVNDYKVCLERNPNSGKILYYLAELYAVMQRKDLALSTIEKGLKTNSHWVGKIKVLQTRILNGEQINLHAPFSN